MIRRLSFPLAGVLLVMAFLPGEGQTPKRGGILNAMAA